jgi:hypothetical protein
MNNFFVSVIMSLSIAASALGQQAGYVRNIIEDDEGIKVILASTREQDAKQDIKTYYLFNTQVDFEKVKVDLTNLKRSKLKVLLNSDALNKVTIRQAGK